MIENYMKQAIKEANKALQMDEMPVGCVIVYKNEIVGKGFNKKEDKKNSLMHAEIIAINQACKKIGDWRLNECEMYVTLEPCLMCLGAIIESRIKKIYCGVTNNKFHDLNLKISNVYQLDIEYDIMQSEINEQLSSFFKKIRNKEKKNYFPGNNF